MCNDKEQHAASFVGFVVVVAVVVAKEQQTDLPTKASEADYESTMIDSRNLTTVHQ